MSSAQIKVNGTLGSVSNLTIGTPAVLTNNNNTGATTWAWSFLDIPEGSTATLSTPTASTSGFTPDVEGTYLVELQVNGGGGPNTDAQYGAVLTLETGLRIPAAGETTEENLTRGWAQSLNRTQLSLETQQLSGNKLVGIADSALTAGHVGYLTGVGTLPNGNTYPTVSPASASAHDSAQNLVYILTSASGAGKPVLLLSLGAVVSTLNTSAATKGDPVYLSNSGTLSLSAGTIAAIVGTVVTLSSSGVVFVHTAASAGSSVRVFSYSGSNPNSGFDNIAGNTGDLLQNTTNNGFAFWRAQAGGTPATWVPAGREAKITPTAVSYQVLAKDSFVRVTSTASARTITLPDVTTIPVGWFGVVKDCSFSNTGNNTVVQGHASELIDGNSTFSILADGQGNANTFTWNGTTWDVT